MSGKDEQPILAFSLGDYLEGRMTSPGMKNFLRRKKKLEKEFENGGKVCAGCLSKVLNINNWCITCNHCTACCNFWNE